YEAVPAREAVSQATIAAERAIQLDASAAEGYAARGVIRGPFEYNWHAAGTDFDKAIQLNPEFPLAHYRRAIWYLTSLGRRDEAVAEVRRSAELDPLSPLTRGAEAIMLQLAGLTQEAVLSARSAVELFPNSFFVCFACGMVLGGSDSPAEAEGVLER